MSLFARWRLSRAARPYARRLTARLRQGWGRSETYTKAQIDVSVRALRLNPAHVAIAYAALLEPEGLAALGPQTLFGLDEGALRAAFRHWRPVVTAWGPPEAGLGVGPEADSGGGGGHGGH